MIGRPARLALVTLFVAACAPGGDGETREVAVVSGPNLPGAEIIRSEGVVSTGEGGTSGQGGPLDATVTTDVRFGPQFLQRPGASGGLALLLAQFRLGPLLTRVESTPGLTTMISNTGDEEVAGVLLESTFAIDGEPRSGVGVSGRSDAGQCTVAGPTISCPIGTIAAGAATTAVIEVRRAAIPEGTVTTVTTRVRTGVEQPVAGPSPSPGGATPAGDAP